MDHAPHMNRPSLAATSLLAHAKAIGRFLLVLAAVELISMPLTQYAWNWDHFLHGGMDFESSLLFLVICLGLLLVLRDHRRNERICPSEVAVIAAQSSTLANRSQFLEPDSLILPSRACGGFPDLAKYNSPLQI